MRFDLLAAAILGLDKDKRLIKTALQKNLRWGVRLFLEVSRHVRAPLSIAGVRFGTSCVSALAHVCQAALLGRFLGAGELAEAAASAVFLPVGASR